MFIISFKIPICGTWMQHDKYPILNSNDSINDHVSFKTHDKNIVLEKRPFVIPSCCFIQSFYWNLIRKLMINFDEMDKDVARSKICQYSNDDEFQWLLGVEAFEKRINILPMSVLLLKLSITLSLNLLL